MAATKSHFLSEKIQIFLILSSKEISKNSLSCIGNETCHQECYFLTMQKGCQLDIFLCKPMPHFFIEIKIGERQKRKE
jgi:hypothetical protein